MKKKILITVLLSSLFLMACQNNPNEQAVTDDIETEDNDTNKEAEATDTEETGETEDEAAEEEVEYQYAINPDNSSVELIEPSENADEKLVLLTFDDAPYGNAMEIANALDERDVSAIFFVNSMYMDNDEGFEIIQKLHKMGFEIANHTHTHAKLDDYTEAEQREEILTTNEYIKEATGEDARFFRAPHGVMTDYVKQLIPEENMTWMNWSFGYDWMGEYHEPDQLVDITLNTHLLGNGSNILMHDRTWTAAAIPEIVDGLIEQGFTIVDPKLITHE